MTSYEILDIIADSYIPLLFLAYLIFSIHYFNNGDKLAWLRGLSGVLIAYILMFIDQLTHVWKFFSLDYSTHSAIAFVLIAFHIHRRPITTTVTMCLIFSLVAYYCLEVYQKYHTFADIASTVAVIGPLLVVSYYCTPNADMRGNSR